MNCQIKNPTVRDYHMMRKLLELCKGVRKLETVNWDKPEGEDHSLDEESLELLHDVSFMSNLEHISLVCIQLSGLRLHVELRGVPAITD